MRANINLLVAETPADMNGAGAACNSPPDAKQKSATIFKRSREEYIQVCEVLVFIPVMLIITGLFCIPAIFYALPLPAEVSRAGYMQTQGFFF